MNSVNLTGNLCADPETKTFHGENGDFTVCDFSIAVNRPKRKGEETVKTDFIACRASGSRADYLCKYAKKGSRIGVTGALRVDQYEKDGQKHYKTYIDLGNGTLEIFNGVGTQKSDSKPTTERTYAPTEDDELPF